MSADTPLRSAAYRALTQQHYAAALSASDRLAYDDNKRLHLGHSCPDAFGRSQHATVGDAALLDGRTTPSRAMCWCVPPVLQALVHALASRHARAELEDALASPRTGWTAYVTAARARERAHAAASALDPHRIGAAEAAADLLAFLDAQTQPPGEAPALIVTGPPQPDDDGRYLHEALLAVMCPPLLTRGARVVRSTTAPVAHRLAQAGRALQMCILDRPLTDDQVAALSQAWSPREDLPGQIDVLVAATT